MYYSLVCPHVKIVCGTKVDILVDTCEICIFELRQLEYILFPRFADLKDKQS